MTQSVKQIVAAAVLLGLLAFVAVRGSGGKIAELWQSMNGQSSTMPAVAIDEEESLRRYGFRLTESAQACGIDFKHEAPTLDKRLDHIMPLVNPMGAAVAIVDFDRDGWLDLYTVT